MSASPAEATKKSQWSEYKNAEGRVYWSHSVTKQSVWEKPDELKTPFEKALTKTKWKQYTSNGRPYYVHSATKETKWDLPAELKDLRKKVDEAEAYKAEREKRKAEGLASPTPPRSRSATPDDIRELRASAANAIAPYVGPGGSSSASPYIRGSASPAKAATPKIEPFIMPPGGFLTHAKAEEAFIYLLKREGIDENSTWDQTMRKIIMDPLYKALETLAEKKTAFEKHIRNIVDERRAAKEARIARLRPIFHKMFAHTPAIRSYSTMKTANEVFALDRHWREALEDERRLILEEYVDDLRRAEEFAGRELRDRNMRTLSSLVRDLDITVSTRWRAAHDLIVSSATFKEDKDLQKIETIDMIDVYDEYARQLEQEHEEESRRLRVEMIRKARKAREGFKALLAELESKGELTRLSQWKETYPKIKNDERYHALVGVQGSSPLDLWMDAVDDLGEEVERAAEKVERALSKEGKTIKLETEWEAVEEWIKELHIESQIEEKLRKEVYKLIHTRLKQAAEDEARRAERKRRHRIDDLRYALKKVQRHIDLEMTYEEAVPHMRDLPEFKDIAEEEDRKAAFEKFVSRQKEKLREAESSDIGSARGGRDHDREKERRYSSSKTRDVDSSMDIDKVPSLLSVDEKDKKARYEKEHRSRRDDRDRDRERDGHRDRDRKDRGDRGTKDRETERKDREREREPDDREHKRRRTSTTKKDEVEEGEI
ncbi:hypothetical protein IAR55_007146 [Kwoniella newhampshirensis]|uniref:Pre-mRNA-processing factor 40 n=1 Tax=Kwoniella newhampshirensis TaxID=1651941 RepID=A0AAW0YSJ8_9TREE